MTQPVMRDWRKIKTTVLEKPRMKLLWILSLLNLLRRLVKEKKNEINAFEAATAETEKENIEDTVDDAASIKVRHEKLNVASLDSQVEVAVDEAILKTEKEDNETVEDEYAFS